MSRPGVVVSSAAATPPLGVPTDTSVGFMVAEASQGPTNAPQLITSMDDFTATYGARIPGTSGYDAVDAALHEGATAIYYQRVSDGGTAATASGVPITTSASTITAQSAGAWGNTCTLTTVLSPTLFALGESESKGSKKSKSADDAPAVEVERSELLTYDVDPRAGTTFICTVSVGGSAVQTSAQLTTNQDLASFLAQGQYATLTAFTAADLVKAGTVTLAGGVNGTIPASASAVTAALALIPAELGPGNISAPGKTDSTTRAALLAHAASNNRVAFCDGGATDSTSALQSAAAGLRGSVQDRYGALFAPWAVIPGLSPGTTRNVPWSAIQTGICARNDQAGTVNQAGAGSWGESLYAVDLTMSYVASDMETLLYAGVNTARKVYGTIENYAFRTLVDPNGPRAAWRELNHARLNMAIVAQASDVGEEYIFGQLDGRGHLISAFGGALAGMLIGMYNADELYGDDATEAFLVNVGPSVNTPASLADGQLSAVLSVRMSPHAELVNIYIVKVPITVSLV
jgi:hypothetical protein